MGDKAILNPEVDMDKDHAATQIASHLSFSNINRLPDLTTSYENAIGPDGNESSNELTNHSDMDRNGNQFGNRDRNRSPIPQDRN